MDVYSYRRPFFGIRRIAVKFLYQTQGIGIFPIPLSELSIRVKKMPLSPCDYEV